MPLGHFLKNVPHIRGLSVDHLLRRTHRMTVPQLLQTADNKGLKESQRHLLWQATLVHLELRPDHDHGTAGVIHSLPKQVLAETSPFTLQHVRERLKRAITCARDRPTMSPVIEERIHSLLEHSFLVPDNHLGSFQLEKILQTIIPVDDSAIEIVKVRGRKAATLQGNEWSQIRWNHGQDRHDHPLGTGIGVPEASSKPEPLGQLLAGLL